jgi:hypothetical protein
MRRALFEIIDPSPRRKDVEQVWAHFQSACAYCERALEPGTKQAHLDHLVPSSEGGRNHIGNRVLSCATCNEKEKLEAAWEQFLRGKAENDAEFTQRKQRILAWQARFDPEEIQLSPELVEFVNGQVKAAVAAFMNAATTIRNQKPK